MLYQGGVHGLSTCARDKDSRCVVVRSASGSGMGLTAEPRESVERG